MPVDKNKSLVVVEDRNQTDSKVVVNTEQTDSKVTVDEKQADSKVIVLALCKPRNTVVGLLHGL